LKNLRGASNRIRREANQASKQESKQASKQFNFDKENQLKDLFIQSVNHK
jgi:hypothetical protein